MAYLESTNHITVLLVRYHKALYFTRLISKWSQWSWRIRYHLWMKLSSCVFKIQNLLTHKLPQFEFKLLSELQLLSTTRLEHKFQLTHFQPITKFDGTWCSFDQTKPKLRQQTSHRFGVCQTLQKCYSYDYSTSDNTDVLPFLMKHQKSIMMTNPDKVFLVRTRVVNWEGV